MEIEIQRSGEIYIDGGRSGYTVSQLREGTRLYKVGTGELLPMPHNRYSLDADSPEVGVAGLAKFEADFIQATSEERHSQQSSEAGVVAIACLVGLLVLITMGMRGLI